MSVNSHNRMRLLLTLLMLPTKLAHELTHMVAGLPFAHQLDVKLRPRTGEAQCRVVYFDDTPEWVVWAGHLAPALVGALLGLFVIGYWLLTDVPLPETVLGWGKLSIGCILWAHYTAPSPADLRIGGADE